MSVDASKTESAPAPSVPTETALLLINAVLREQLNQALDLLFEQWRLSKGDEQSGLDDACKTFMRRMGRDID